MMKKVSKASKNISNILKSGGFHISQAPEYVGLPESVSGPLRSWHAPAAACQLGGLMKNDLI
jgi:hypothetical protein